MADAHPYRTLPSTVLPWVARTQGDRLEIRMQRGAPIPIRMMVAEAMLCLLLLGCSGLDSLRAATLAVITLACMALRVRAAVRSMDGRLAFDRRSLRITRPLEYWASSRCDTRHIRSFVADGERLVVVRADGAALSLPTTGLDADETAVLASVLERHRHALAA